MALPMTARGKFDSLTFPKEGKDIILAAVQQQTAVQEKIEERQGRIAKVCKDRGLEVADFFGNLNQFVNHTNSDFLQAGEMAQIQEEARQVMMERKIIEELQLIIDNLPADQEFILTFADLRYFGF